MSDPMQPGTPAPGAEGPGIFLPTLIWTTDRKTVGNEMQRLLGRYSVDRPALPSLIARPGVEEYES